MSNKPLVRYSIKERLNSLNRTAQIEESTKQRSLHPEIIVPQQYNYFLNTIDREISHENNIYRRIKRKLSHFKKIQNGKVEIKNSYVFNHKNFSSKTLKKTQERNRLQKSQTNQFPNQQQNPSSFRRYDQNFTSWKKCLGTSSTAIEATPFFVRSNVNTPQTMSQFFPENVQTKLYEITRRIEKELSKQKFSELQGNNLNIVGSEPQWREFQCYHRLKNRYSGIASR